MKLAAELARPDTGQTLYILDEPTTGLHFDDVRKLLDVLHRLADLGNTVVVIEHNLDVIKTADWVIDLGPEAGLGGGDLVAEGTPEAVVAMSQAHTAQFLRPVLDAGPHAERPAVRPQGLEEDGRRRTGHRRGHPPPRRSDRQPHNGQRTTDDGQGGESPLGASTAGSGTRRTGSRPTAGASRWDGRILAMIVDRIEAAGQGGFGPTEWSQRGVVRIKGSDETKVGVPVLPRDDVGGVGGHAAVLRARRTRSAAARWRSCWHWSPSTRSSRRS